MLVDGVGNRIAASVFGPKEVLFIVGENKIVANLNEGLRRIRQIAGPQRARQMGVPTPCVEAGECCDCQVPKRICRATVIIDRPSFGMKAAVWLVRANLGL